MKIRFKLINIFCTVMLLFTCAALSIAQPSIKLIDKTKGSMGEVVTLRGTGFGTNPAQLVVNFGAAIGEIVSVSDQVIEVKVPAGATYDNVSVSHLPSGTIAYTREQFLLDFNGDDSQPFDINNLEGQFDIPAGPAAAEGLYDLCMCDFDGDKKNDIATANDNVGFVTLYSNTSSGPGNVAFAGKFAINILSRSLQVKCGDLNGDGKSEIIATEKGSSDKVFILANKSTGIGNFQFASQSLTLSGQTPKRIEIADIDLDGRPELIITSQATNIVSVLVNKSSGSAIAFSPTPVNVVIPNIESTDGLAVEDINGDNFPEIITSQFQTNTDIFIAENKSLPGTISFPSIVTLPVGTAVKNIRAGDVDGDGKIDIAYTQLAPSSSAGVLLNQSSSSSISFGGVQPLTTDANPWGLDFGDLDGDGKLDIVIASITKKSLAILNNNSSPGNVSFQTFIKETTYVNRHVVIGDVDNDGKPDIAFTSIDDGNLGIAASKVSIFRNKTCMVPEVNPEGPLSICDSNPTSLTSTQGGGVTYEWTNQTISSTVTDDHTFTPTAPGLNDYYVTAKSEGGSCAKTSNTVKLKIIAGTAGNPDPVDNPPVCLGQNLDLTLTTPNGSHFYRWTGPNGFEKTGASVQVTSAKLVDAGTYFVEVYVGGDATTGCLARTESTVVQVVDIPDFRVLTPADVVCEGDLKNMNVFPNAAGFDYQWYEKTSGIIAGANVNVLPIGGSGEYYFTATDITGNCGSTESAHINIAMVSYPEVLFSFPAEACKGQEITFKNESITDTQTTAFFTWSLGSSKTSTDQNPKHIFPTIGNYTIKLTVSYKDGACAKSETKPLTIIDAPTASIATEGNRSDLCADETLVLEVLGSFTSFTWSTGETIPTITIDEPGEYTVKVAAPGGCELTTSKVIGAFAPPIVLTSVEKPLITEGESTTITAEGLTTFNWTPVETLNDPTLASPLASPITSTTYTVTGVDINGCTGEGSIEVKVEEKSAITQLTASNFFSPNDDGTHAYWTVESIMNYPQCGVTIYDDKGVKVYAAKPYLNDWDGTFNGTRLPDGVYYYIIRCDGDENKPKSGSITLLR